MTAIWNDTLLCNVERIVYCFATKTGEVWMPDGSCTDMSGAIGLFSKIDADVRTIITWAGGKMDTVYVCNAGKWEAQISEEHF